MSAALRMAVRAAALAGPVALAFASGGFYDRPRLIALIAVAGLLGVWALVGDGPLPRDRRALLALGALAGYCAWVALSADWAPLAEVAHADLERALLYLGALTLGATLWRGSRRAARAVEPAVAAGVLAVMGYGLAGRLLPGIVELAPGRLAGSRLFQPLTYWNGQGELAAIGLILCARLAGDRTRPGVLRAMAAAAAVPIGVALYLTFSRGALVTLAGGLVVLLALAPSWSQLRGMAIALEAAGAGIVTCAALPGVNDLAGDLRDREADGAIALAVLLVLMLLAAAGAAWARRAEDEERTRLGRLPLPARAPWIAGAIAIALIAVPIASSGGDHPGQNPAFSQTTGRLTSTGSNRYQYWKVALKAAADHPLKGVGTGGFGPEWMRERTIGEVVRDAHSLYLETLAELGIIGLLLLAVLIGSIFACARAAYREDPALAAGPIAALTAFALHTGIDWDWELPALTLVALSLAGLLLSRVPGRSAG
ncbi:MAG: O-antigen ligase family protein [Solirubrobacteraceae bacterium]